MMKQTSMLHIEDKGFNMKNLTRDNFLNKNKDDNHLLEEAYGNVYKEQTGPGKWDNENFRDQPGWDNNDNYEEEELAPTPGEKARSGYDNDSDQVIVVYDPHRDADEMIIGVFTDYYAAVKVSEDHDALYIVERLR